MSAGEDSATALAIRPMVRAELDIALEWAAREGWNPGLDDADAFLAADPDGFLMGFLGDEPVACISVVAYGAAFGFLGLYICRPEYRGKGYGFQLWQAGMARMGDRAVGLDGVVDQQANYAKSGFVFAHRNVRFGGTARTDGGGDPAVVDVESDALADAVLAYDRPLFPAPREAFLRRWIAPARRRTLAYAADGRLRGYGTIRPCRHGLKIGPLFADDERIADGLFAALAAPHPGAPVFLDAPEVNGAAIALAERHGLEPSFETARMVRGSIPDLPLARIFGITTFELG